MATQADTFTAPATATRPLRVFVTAAEVSGDRHAAQFIRSLQAMSPGVVVEGYGGPEMRAAGANVLQDTVANAAMGIRGALRAVEVYKLLRKTRRRFDIDPPDLWVGTDSPSMNFHFARAAKERGIPTLQFVAPQLWGWAKWRMKKLRRWVDEVACVLPFEEAWFRSHGVKATFVGHPLFDELPPRRESPPGPRFPDRPPIIGLLPGSRRGVASANFPRLLQAAEIIVQQFPKARFVVPTTEATDPIVRRALASLSTIAPRFPASQIDVAEGAFDAVVPTCDLCLTVSGTATLHVASFGVPMIVVYAGSRLMWKALGQFLIKSRTFAMVNLLADETPLKPDPLGARHVVPEFVPWYGSVDPVAQRALQMLKDPQLLADQKSRLDAMVRRLDQPGASDQVAAMALRLVGR